MTLTTHAVIGAAVAAMLPQQPALGLTAAFASHFLADAIPHWDYKIYSASLDPMRGGALRINRAFWLDAARIGADGLLGLLLPLLFFSFAAAPWLVLCGAVLGMLPDVLQFVYLRMPREPFASLRRLHLWMHAKTDLDEHPVWGVITQAAIIALVLFLFRTAVSVVGVPW